MNSACMCTCDVLSAGKLLVADVSTSANCRTPLRSVWRWIGKKPRNMKKTDGNYAPAR